MLTCKRSKFSLPSRITYLNCSYLSPMLKVVEKAGLSGLRLKRNPAQVSAGDFFTQSAELRKAYGNLIGARGDRIAIVPSVSYGMATVAQNLNLEKGQNIVVAAEQFPSNFYVWQRLCGEKSASLNAVSPPDALQGRGKIWNERILEAINAKTRAVAIAHTHWADGTRFDLAAIRARANDVGAALLIDGTQSVGALPFDISDIRPDALVCAGYKWLLGPYAIGLAYYGERFDGGKPLEENWISRLNSEDFTALVSYNQNYQPGALRYDVGERSNFILVPMMLKAVEQLGRWGVDKIQDYCKRISADAIAALQQKGYWIEEPAYRGGHIFGIRLPKEMKAEKLKAVMHRNNIHVSYRGSGIRVSPNVYNDERDLRKLASVLTKI